MKVLVNGIGNIGTTLLNLLCDYKEALGLDAVYGLKNTDIAPWNRSDLDMLSQKGVTLCGRGNNSDLTPLDEVIASVDYIFDCNANTIGNKNKAWYESLPNLKGCSAQGSEKGFGIPYMAGFNDNAISNQPFVHVVSCNTHALASLLTTIAGSDLADLVEADFVVVRRSEDLGQHQRLVSANVVSRHMDETTGTHHAVDVIDLFRTLGLSPIVQSSDITTPSQLMHAVRFNVRLKATPDLTGLQQAIEDNPLMSTTQKYDSNVVFEQGRKYSPYGRLFSQAIVVSNNLLIDEERHLVKGWAFIPQEGNTILSTIRAFLMQTNSLDIEAVMDQLRQDLIKKEW